MHMLNYTYPFAFEGDYEVIPAPDSVAIQQPFAARKKEGEVTSMSTKRTEIPGMEHFNPTIDHPKPKKHCGSPECFGLLLKYVHVGN